MLIDLQLHSTCSDGYLTPSEVAKTCRERGVKVASLTDHNTVSGQEEFARACKELKIKAGFTADREIHELTQKIIAEYRPALEELARK